MEEPRQAKRRIQLPVIGGGGGGIEGLVVWGGALAVASLVAVFTIRKGRKNDDAKTGKDQQAPVDLLNESGMKEREDVGGKVLRFVIPEPHSTINENSSEKFYEAGAKEIDPSESVPAWNSISEENALQTTTAVNGENKNSTGGHQEILLSDTEQESIAISEDYCVAEEFPLPVLDSELESMNKSGKDAPSKMETFDTDHVTGEKSSSMGSSLSSASSTDEEGDSPIQSSISWMMSTEEEDESSAIQSTLSTEEGKEDNEEDGHAMEKSEESWEGTQISSMKCTVDAVWPAEMVEALSSESEGMNLSSQIPGEKYDKEAKTGDYCYLENGNNGCIRNTRMLKKKKETSEGATKRRIIWVNSIVVLMLLFLLACFMLSFYLPSNNVSTIPKV